MSGRLLADAGAGVADAYGALEHRQLLARESVKQQLDQLGEEERPLRERALASCVGEVERVEADGVVAGERQVDAADGVAETAVLVLGVEHEHLHALEEQAQ